MVDLSLWAKFCVLGGGSPTTTTFIFEIHRDYLMENVRCSFRNLENVDLNLIVY